MKIWKIVFVLLTAFSLASCDKEDENNMMLIICYHTDGTMTSVVERGTYTYDAVRRVLTLVDADGFAKYYSVSSNKAYQLSLRQTLGDTQIILELTKIIENR